MFTTQHFIWLAICAIGIAALTFCSIKFKWSLKTAILVVAGISVASELCKIFTHIDPVGGEDWLKGGVISAGALPFHLCSITIFAYFYLALTKPNPKHQYILDFIVPIGVIGGVLALLIPTSGVEFSSIYSYQCFVYHSGIIWFSLYCLITGAVKMTWKIYLRNLATLFALSLIMIWVNGALQAYNTNFLYVVRPPMKNLPFLNLKHGWYVYYAHLLSGGLALMSLFSIPAILLQKKQ